MITATSPVMTNYDPPDDATSPEEDPKVATRHDQFSASDVHILQRQRSTTEVQRRTKIKRFPTIMTPSYGKGGNGISRVSLLHRQFYSKTEKITVLSPDMEAKIHEKICRSLGAKYGSLERATEAAVTIQKTYRGYKLRRHFEEIRREGNVQLFRSSSLDARERRKYLTMGTKEKGAADGDVECASGKAAGGGGGGGKVVEVGNARPVLDKPVPPALSSSSLVTEGGRDAPAKGVAPVGVVMRRSKSHSAVLTRQIREEGEEEEEVEEEEEEREYGWNRTVGVHLFNR